MKQIKKQTNFYLQSKFLPLKMLIFEARWNKGLRSYFDV